MSNIRTDGNTARGVNAGALAALVLGGAALCVAPASTKNSRRQNEHERADAARGSAVFEAKCAICHYSSSTATKIGPGLKGLSERGTFTNGEKADNARLREWIEKGGKNMPGFKNSLTTEQVRDLVAYLKTL